MRWAGLFLLLVGCSLKSGEKPCSRASDCSLPFVCCTRGPGLEVQGYTEPTCISRLGCGPGDYLGILAEGDPCGRTLTGDACGEDLVCCDKSMSCRTEGGCARAAFPAVAVSSGAACANDSECGEGNICCGINYDLRGGTCQSVEACLASVGRTLDRPDGGVGDAGMISDSRAEQICALAYCGPDGVVTPTQTQRERCLATFVEPSLYSASAECLTAVENSRNLCPYLFRHREGLKESDRQLPVLPAACRLSPEPAHAEVEAACNKLEVCGLWTDNAACRALLAGFNFDTLSRISDTVNCDFQRPRMGWAPKNVNSRCQVDTDCPENFVCEAQATRHGICRMRSCEERTCGLAGGSCQVGHCLAACTPSIKEAQSHPSVAALWEDCGGRVDLSGQRAEMACQQLGNSSGIGTGVCIPYPDVTQCLGSVERIIYEGRYRGPGGYICQPSPAGNLALGERCNPSSGVDPDPCAEGFCDPIFRVCSHPCVVLGTEVVGTCPGGSRCISGYGWGTPGFCHPICQDNSQCNGGRCQMSEFPGNFCSP